MYSYFLFFSSKEYIYICIYIYNILYIHIISFLLNVFVFDIFGIFCQRNILKIRLKSYD